MTATPTAHPTLPTARHLLPAEASNAVNTPSAHGGPGSIITSVGRSRHGDERIPKSTARLRNVPWPTVALVRTAPTNTVAPGMYLAASPRWPPQLRDRGARRTLGAHPVFSCLSAGTTAPRVLHHEVRRSRCNKHCCGAWRADLFELRLVPQASPAKTSRVGRADGSACSVGQNEHSYVIVATVPPSLLAAARPTRRATSLMR